VTFGPASTGHISEHNLLREQVDALLEGGPGAGLDEAALLDFLPAHPQAPADLSVSTGKLATGAVTDAKVTDVGADKITESSTKKVLTSTERTKLAGVASGATANSADATLLARTNHTGTQAQSTVTNLVTDLAARAPLANVRLTIYATAANTWPVRSSSVPAGFTGFVDWDHSAFGTVTTLPATMISGDFVTDLAP
jgi:hypothetical protein